MEIHKATLVVTINGKSVFIILYNSQKIRPIIKNKAVRNEIILADFLPMGSMKREKNERQVKTEAPKPVICIVIIKLTK